MISRLFGRKSASSDDALGGICDITLYGQAAKKEFVDLEALCGALGVGLETQPYKPGLHGTLQRQCGKWTIGVSGSLSFNRRRFVIAHEIGHYILHRDLVALREGTAGVTDDADMRQLGGSLHNPHVLPLHERQANEMAFRLLMGAEKMRFLLKEGLDAAQIAPLIGVTKGVVEIRIETLKAEAQ